MQEPLERRDALPAHPLPAGLAAPDDWRLRVDGLVAQPLVLSLHEVDALAAQAHRADVVCEEGWVVPEPQQGRRGRRGPAGACWRTARGPLSSRCMPVTLRCCCRWRKR